MPHPVGQHVFAKIAEGEGLQPRTPGSTAECGVNVGDEKCTIQMSDILVKSQFATHIRPLQTEFVKGGAVRIALRSIHGIHPTAINI